MAPLLQVRDLRFAHGRRSVLHDVSLEIDEGGVLVIVGPSGCGKTTLLRVIAGLELPTSGSVYLGGKALCGEGRSVPPEQRPIGMVFQGLALFPHLTVAGNVGFGLAHLKRAEREAMVEQELESVDLSGLKDRYPHQLSGGQQQRVAIARALARRPRLLLMDEPFSDLDAHTRSAVRAEVQRILRAHGTAAIIVSHDREDALHLGDRIALMDDGRIISEDAADALRRSWKTHPFAQ
ncbi:MAG: ABC transporter ATP-binding protein [Flavobacteriales bacterium]|nr:ABC transporter ATP-binding protein [Flavobacteriales bacterium]MCB9168593.1 ABC transporter ATP-binding protein [Flavobacteriales bacterium]